MSAEGATEAPDYEAEFNATDALCGAAATPAAFYASPAFHVLVALLYGGVLLAGVAGNALVCAVVRASPRMRTVTNYFIVNLAVADMLMALLCVPATSFSQLIARAWPWGGAACRGVNYAQAVSVLVSAYTLVAVSAHRAAAVLRPLRPRPGAGAARAALAAVWVAALATAAPILLVSGLVRPTLWHRICQVDICAEQWGDAGGGLAHYTAALLALQFGVPLLALAGSHARVALAVCARQAPGEAQRDRDSQLHSSKRKMVKMMVMVVVVFTVCWLPFNVLMVAWTTAPGAEEWSAWAPLPYVWFATHWLAMSHCCYNPLIYCYMNARYRRGFKQAIRRVLCLSSIDDPARRPSTLNEALALSELVSIRRVRRGPASSSTASGKRRDGA